jgi:hypothetical protein
MAYRFTIRNGLAVAAATGLAGAAMPAEALDMRRGFLPGLIGGFALGAFAAEAHAAPHRSALQGFVPNDFESAPEWEVGPVEILRTVPAERRRVRPRRERAEQPSRAASRSLENCRDSLASSSRRFGSVTVRVADAGPATRGRGGAVEIPITARIAYTHKGQTQVRQARVVCELDRRGRVLAFR